MTIKVNIIEGRRGSICNNDAFSVVANGKDVIDIIPAAEVPGKTAQDIKEAFEKAATGRNDILGTAVKATARAELGLPTPKGF